MNSRWILVVCVGIVMCACQSSGSKSEEAEGLEAGEVKITLSETPPAVRTAIERELVGAKLEDIARKTQHGATVYETDIEKNGETWEIVFGEDGRTISKHEEEGDDEHEGDEDESAESNGGWREDFAVSQADLAATGDNKWLTIQAGRVLKLRHGADSLTITILHDTVNVDGVEVGVLEERETKNQELIEVSRNFFATDKRTDDVYYFGEDVDNYRDGKIANHDSAWRSGVKGARFGLMIPGAPKLGDKYYQEIAPKVAMDRVEIVSIDETVKTPAGTFEHCLHLKETTPIESDVSHKWYAPGVGMIKDDEFELAEMP